MAINASKVLLVDDHPIVRAGLSLMIGREADFTVCGEAEDARSALLAVETLAPDVAVVDISMNGPSGMEIIRSIRETNTKLGVLVLSMHSDITYAERALRIGANGYLMKQEATEKVLVALRRIVAGEVYVSELVAGKMLRLLSSRARPQRPLVEELTDREMEVFRLLGEGRGTRQISRDLGLSVKTVETYEAHIKEKMGFTDARDLLRGAVQWLINEGGKPETAMAATANS